MPSLYDIEVMNQWGIWVRFSTVLNEDGRIEAAFQSALNDPRFANASQARAVHQSTKQVITGLMANNGQAYPHRHPIRENAR